MSGSPRVPDSSLVPDAGAVGAKIGFVLTSQQAWDAYAQSAPRGQWLSLSEIYEAVRRNAVISDDDERPMSSANRSPRWKRTVRNTLQRRKASGDVEWDHAGRYRLP